MRDTGCIYYTMVNFKYITARYGTTTLVLRTTLLLYMCTHTCTHTRVILVHHHFLWLSLQELKNVQIYLLHLHVCVLRVYGCT